MIPKFSPQPNLNQESIFESLYLSWNLMESPVMKLQCPLGLQNVTNLYGGSWFNVERLNFGMCDYIGMCDYQTILQSQKNVSRHLIPSPESVVSS